MAVAQKVYAIAEHIYRENSNAPPVEREWEYGRVCALRAFPVVGSTPCRCDKRHSGHQEQDENHLAKRAFIELAVEHPAQPCPDEQRRQPEQEQADGVEGDQADTAEGRDDHEKACNAGRLKNGSLLIA